MSNGLPNESGCIVLTWHILFSAEAYGLSEVRMDYLFKALFLFGVKNISRNLSNEYSIFLFLNPQF